MGKTINRDHIAETAALTAKVLILPESRKAEPNVKQIQNNKRLETIIERILEYHGKTREAVAEYCKAAIEEGFTGMEAWDYLCIKLKDKVAKSTLYDWGNKYLPEGSMKVTKPNGATKKIPAPESSKSERSLPQKQLQQKQQQEGRRGYLNEEHVCYKDVELEALRKKNAASKYTGDLNTKYTVYCELELKDAGLLCIPHDDKDSELLNCDFLPVLVHVDALKQTATVELDKDAHIELIKEASEAEADSPNKPKKSTKKSK